ncbi:AAA family ATPase [Endozoicomonas ascidiicola]|uniref:AAA family ATPase n=1 Tax=Endozoicomonas ascidiicola TaxID=1698521 RepID=UPI0008297924|nr:AAA family ATPase [Endozoicomonas ascidiicola]
MDAIIKNCLESMSGVIRGKDNEVRLALCCFLARGHLLIEDLPGMGKTAMALSFSRLLGLEYQRIQFTSDLLPADILGVSIFDQSASDFQFKPGPVFTGMLLADEVNRASPRTQSALLEAMEERQVTVDGEARMLPKPFIVIATQNPVFQEGTFALPESQQDRFLMQIHMGYPDTESEKAILKGEAGRLCLNSLEQAMTAEELLLLQEEVDKVSASDLLLDYILRLLKATRSEEHFEVGLSPRAGLALLQAAKAWARIDGRNYVVPEDVQAVFLPVARHRLITSKHGISPSELLARVNVMV